VASVFPKDDQSDNDEEKNGAQDKKGRNEVPKQGAVIKVYHDSDTTRYVQWESNLKQAERANKE
jgi:hypothetical protein